MGTKVINDPHECEACPLFLIAPNIVGFLDRGTAFL
jgi:hypothetical protein